MTRSRFELLGSFRDGLLGCSLSLSETWVLALSWVTRRNGYGGRIEKVICTVLESRIGAVGVWFLVSSEGVVDMR